jgi:hypothetical protein
VSTCPHGKPIGATCYVCAAEAVAAHFDIQTATGYRLDALMKIPVRPYGMTDEEARALHNIGEIIEPGSALRAIAIVALRRIVDRAVSVEIDSTAQVDEILRIALKALNQLEE